MFKIIPNKKLCQAYRCGNEKASRDRFCPKHRKRWQKINNAAAYHYNLLKSNAKRRGKEFSLTLAEFKQFCKETNYLELKGKHKRSASIDRINHKKGYEVGNIQILTLSENSIKGNDEKAPF